MTDMDDWASKEAWKFASSFDDCTNADEQHEVATELTAALRKAKADGMKEAADIAFSYMGCLGESSAHMKQRGDMLARIKVAASKLETPTE